MNECKVTCDIHCHHPHVNVLAASAAALTGIAPNALNNIVADIQY